MGTKEIVLRWGRGYGGKLGHRCYVARVTGTDRQYGLRREFLQADRVEQEHFNRSRTMINFFYDLAPGLYEASEGGERRMIVVWVAGDGEVRALNPRDERVVKMVSLIDGGMTAEEARLATRSVRAS